MEDCGYIKIISNKDVIKGYVTEFYAVEYYIALLKADVLDTKRDRKKDVLRYIDDYFHINDEFSKLLPKLKSRKNIYIKIEMGGIRYILDTKNNIDELVVL